MDQTPRLPILVVLLGASVLLAGCAASSSQDPPPGDDADMRSSGTDGPPPPPACDPGPPPPSSCPVTIRYQAGGPPRQVFVAGEWNGWNKAAQRLSGPDAQGLYEAEIQLPVGVHAYKLVVDDQWLFDPSNNYRKYHGGVENSGLRVQNCGLPGLRLQKNSPKITRAGAGQGAFQAVIDYVPPKGGQALCSLQATLRSSKDGHAPRALNMGTEVRFNGDRTRIELDLGSLPDGKYLLRLMPKAGDRNGEPLLLPFWIEERPFSWTDTPIYMAMTDRFMDGDKGNNPAPIDGVVPVADYKGGDLKGVEDKIREGYFDRRGIRALWLTPWQTQTKGRFRDQSDRYWVSSFHGYWPIKAREVDPRLGGNEALQRLVQEAHRHGIRILMDAVLNHVHKEHEYFQDPAKKSWFRTGCTCGTAGCDWTEKRLSCLFADYMPDIDWTVPEASEQFIDDSLYWLEEYDLDGLRVDAVKHVEDLSILNLGMRVRERFHTAGTRYYLLGETAMGWVDGSIDANKEQYETIRRYMGPDALDGQFDFVLYHAVPYRAFARDDRRFLHVDYWTKASLDQFRGFDMVRYLGSHDTPRFVSLATYRDQAPGFGGGIPHNKWDNLPVAPPDQEPYDRLFLGLLHLMTTPGIPLLYYGDEYGEYGGSDPDNRHFMRFSGLSPRETAQDTKTTALLAARTRLLGLSRGDLKTLIATEDLYAYARPDRDPKGGALVVMNRQNASQMVTVALPAELGWKPGDALRDYLNGTDYAVSGTMLALTVPARGGVILGIRP